MTNRIIRCPVARLALAAVLALGGGAASGGTGGGGATSKEPAMGTSTREKPAYVTALEAAYGPPSQAGFGSAVFHETLPGNDDLAGAALSKYRYFVGQLWDRFGESAWMGPWKEVYARTSGVKPDVVAELRGVADRDAQLSVPMILDNVEGADAARAALSNAFDDPAITDLRVFNLGDGGAMSGLLLAGRRGGGETTFLVFLMD